ncbi:MAG: biopolymer transporter ExbD [Deltaproteobacteria bacterium]|jgi:biopolymer transport protein ExbD|nr:MAG: biopolymer transporter ExbD [Deltaproteobacteria bacterium]
MRFSQPKREEISLGISIAPLIDIVFLLLIFFMVTSHFEIMSGIDIGLPDISERGSDQLVDSMIVAIDKTGNCYLKREKVNLRDLYLRLKQGTEQKKINLILQADRDVKHGNVVRIMDLAKKAGVTSITISAQWDPEEVF